MGVSFRGDSVHGRENDAGNATRMVSRTNVSPLQSLLLFLLLVLDLLVLYSLHVMQCGCGRRYRRFGGTQRSEERRGIERGLVPSLGQ
jgi:hypothetical protein